METDSVVTISTTTTSSSSNSSRNQFSNNIPLKKRKNIEDTDDIIILPGTLTKNRIKYAVPDDGLAIKYNKLIYNFDKVIGFQPFRKYIVLFDIFSKRHLVQHTYRIDLLEILNQHDFTPYSPEECHCKREGFTSCVGFLVCFKNFIMERKKYVNHRDDKSEYMKQMYAKHSQLTDKNNFYDSRINSIFIQKINDFEKINSLVDLNKKTLDKLHQNIQTAVLEYIVECPRCHNMKSIDCPDGWKIIPFNNRINMAKLCDYVLKFNGEFLIPIFSVAHQTFLDQTTSTMAAAAGSPVIPADSKIVVYKTTKCNLVFLYDDIFYVLNPHRVILLFDIEVFKRVNFFCNFYFYFTRVAHTYDNNFFINIED